MPPKFFIGTAGWSYKDWINSFYTKNQTKDFDWLEFYSQYFNVVEVNATYYTFLSHAIVEGWVNKVEAKDDFTFVLKLHQNFTHKPKYSKEEIRAVQTYLDILGKNERLGGLLIQFPYSFSHNSISIEYLRKLMNIFEGYNLFFEVRHTSWLTNEAYNFFIENKVSLCMIDQPVLREQLRFNLITNDIAYIRFHGRNKEAWLKSINNFGKKQSYQQQSERYNYLYSPGELIQFVQEIREVYDTINKVYVIMNNHPGGNAVANAFEMIHYLNKRTKVKMPAATSNSFPILKPFAVNN